MPARYEQIAAELREAILGGTYPVGSHLPSEAALAARHSAARGTVRQAVALLASEGLVGSRQGARRVVLRGERDQLFGEPYDFARWAGALGHRAGGEVIGRRRRKASATEAVRLAVCAGEEVLSMLRLRTLDGVPVLVERAVYASWVVPAVEVLEPGCESVVGALGETAGLAFRHGEHLIDAVAAGVQEARLLAVRRGSPLLRRRRLTSTAEGRPVEWSDDRYRAGSVVFATRSPGGVNPSLAGQDGDLR
ncbi:transcriptional regulator [Microtetraspora sp. NBRC 13810]|uniref:GntR family transcriptional regulator n=1 Tax=Microtetraspora sp. NBRC 13810 TaxID=3030990 RepID=UPI0024A5BE34|nr:GntR family transcriptional regulator [Microtetraspora sp. NBRC 13810]GLW10780.1 transcriptional regulator [Microtetraspora sp. NBRC 13810]